MTRHASLIISRQSTTLWRLLGCTGHVPLLLPWGRGRLLRSPWPPAATAATGAASCGFSWPRFLFLFFFLPPLWVTASEPPIWVTPAYGAECQARPSATLAHLSARAKSVVTLSTSCVANFSSIFPSRTPLAERSDYGSIRDMGDCSTYLDEAGNKCPESLPGSLPHCMEVCLHTMLLVSAGAVRHEPHAELFLGVYGPWGLVHEPSPCWPRQGYMEVSRHYGGASTCCRNGGDINLQEFQRVYRIVVLF
jgi:hypothetical protein